MTRHEDLATAHPLVSIITVVYNGAETIADCLHSVASQTYPHIEHIIIDGASTDNTLTIVRGFEHVAECISEPDGGIYHAMNKGLTRAAGQWIAALNSDDMYADPAGVTDIIRFALSGNLDAAYADLIYVDPRRTHKVMRIWRAGAYRRGAFRYGWVPPHPTFVCRRRVYEQFGGFNERFRVAGDFELMLRFLEKHQIRVGYLPRVLVKMRAGGTANRLGGVLRGNREIIEAFRLNGIRISPRFFWKKPLLKFSQLLNKRRAHTAG